MANKNEGYVFGLDIGTRSIVGTVGYRVGTDRFVVVAQEAIEHTTRAVIDGQIHDISTVTNTISEIKSRLENQLHQKLKEVSIAAAGRVLKTKKVYAEMELPNETRVSKEDVKSLDMLGVEKAYEEIREEISDKDKHFFCVGYSIVKYFLNGYPIEVLEKHPATNIGVELIGTFLPEEVVDGLYAAVENAGLSVVSMTLEPIAAIQVAIPEKFRLLNIALVDVGAGTSDISVVDDGSIIAFGMIPLAGDEVTEEIAKNYLVDFETAEFVKRECEKKSTVTFENIFGESFEVTKEDVSIYADVAVDEITRQIAGRIIEMNGGKTVSAVFVVGGGGKHKGFTDKLAKHLGLPKNRVAIRGEEVLKHVDFMHEDAKKDSSMVTPIGICMNYYEKQNNFMHVTVNEQRVKLYDNGKVTILDACVGAGFLKTNLFPVKGETIHYTVNGEEREKKGKTGEVAVIKCNGKEVSLNEFAKEDDEITIKPSTKGVDGRITLAEIPESGKDFVVTLYGKKIICPYLVEVNGKEVDKLYEIQDGDVIQIFDYINVAKVFEYGDIEMDDFVLINGREAGLSAKVVDGDVITKTTKPVTRLKGQPADEEEIEVEEEPAVDEKSDFQKQLEKDPLLQPQKPLPEWMEDVPFDTAKVSADGNIIPGEMDGRQPVTPAKPLVAISITVNGKKVVMPKKEDPIFVDVFDVYPFDMSKVGGTRLITRINGQDKDFTEPLCEGDEVELYWEK